MATKRDFTISYGLQADKTGAGTNTLVVDSINDRVGIGTTTPTAKLQVVGGIKATTSIDTDTQFLGQAADTLTTPSYSWTGDTTTGLYRPAASTLAFTTAGTERLRIGTTYMLVGTINALANTYINSTAITPAIQLEGNNNSTSAISITRQTGGSPNIILQRGTTGTPVINDDTVGRIIFSGFDGTNFRNIAHIASEIDNTVSLGDTPGRLVFSTTADGMTSPTERLRIDSSGRVGIGTTNPTTKLDVGTSANVDADISKFFGRTYFYHQPSITPITNATSGNPLVDSSPLIWNYRYWDALASVSVQTNMNIDVQATSTAPIATMRFRSGTLDRMTLTSDGNLSVTGQIICAQAASSADGGGQIYLSNGTANRIEFGSGGVAAPAIVGTSGATRSVGTKLLLNTGSSTQADYAIGIESNTLWSSVPTTSQSFRWYAGTTNIATLSGTGRVGIGTATPNTGYLSTFYSPTTSSDSGIFIDLNGWTTDVSEYGINLDIDAVVSTDPITADRTYYGILDTIDTYVPSNATTTTGTRRTAYAGFFRSIVNDNPSIGHDSGKLYQVFGTLNESQIDSAGGVFQNTGAYNLAQAAPHAQTKATTAAAGTGTTATISFAAETFVPAVSAASGTGTVATLTFTTQSTIPFPVGTTITVVGMSPAGYNGNYVVTVATTSSVSYSNATTGALVTAGTIGIHPFPVGKTILVEGVTPTGYNGEYVVTAIGRTGTTSTVSYANTTTGAQTVAGTVELLSIIDDMRGAYNYALNSSSNHRITAAYGSYNLVNQDVAGGRMTNAFGVSSRVDAGVGGSTTPAVNAIDTATLYYGEYIGTAAVGLKYGLYLTGETSNYLSGNVGIGTTNPTSKLYVVGGIKATTSIDTDTQFLGQAADTLTTPSYSWTGDTTTGLYRPAASTLAFTTAGTERLRIDSSGHVGIGGATSSTIGIRIIQDAAGADLTVVSANWTATTGTVANIKNFAASRSTAGATITNLYGFFADSILTSATNNYGFYSEIPSSTGRWNFYAAGTANNYFAGNVGIGTTNPTDKLSVAGVGQFVNTNNQLLLHTGTNVPTVILRNDGVDYYHLLSAAGTTPSGTWNTLRPLTINLTSGAVSVGNTGTTIFNAINQTASAARWIVKGNTTGIVNDTGIYQDASNNMQLSARDGSGTLRLVLDSNNTSGSYLNTSAGFSIGKNTTTPGYTDLGTNLRIGAPNSTGTYSMAGTTTITVTCVNHGLATAESVYIDFTSGTAVDAYYNQVTVINSSTFTVVAAAALTTSGNCTIYSENLIRFAGVFGDNPGGYFTTVISERLYGGSDKSELLLFKGNDGGTTIQDNIRLAASGDIYFHAGVGTFSYNNYINSFGNTVASSTVSILASGNVGIGTTNPLYKLEVNGDIKVGELGTLWFSDVANSVQKIVSTNSSIDIYADSFVRFFESDFNQQKFTFDVNNGIAILGHTDTYDIGNASKYLQIYDTSAGAGINVGRWSVDTSGPVINLGKSRGTSIATLGTVINGDELGQITFFGDNATTQVQSANITCLVDTTFTGNTPGALTFSTRVAAGTLAEVMRISSAGNVGIGTTNPNAKLHVFGSVRAQTALNQDAVVLAGRAGGTSSYAVTLTPATLTLARTVTLPNADTTIPVATQVLTFSGPTAARTYTLPDQDTTVVGTATVQTLTNKTFGSNTYSTTQSLTVANDCVFLTAAAAWTLTLPTPTTGKVLYITRTDATAFIITVSGHINGTAATSNVTWFPVSTANRRVILISNGTTWYPMQVATVT